MAHVCSKLQALRRQLHIQWQWPCHGSFELGYFGVNIGRMENNMETTIMGYVGIILGLYRV